MELPRVLQIEEGRPRGGSLTQHQVVAGRVFVGPGLTGRSLDLQEA